MKIPQFFSDHLPFEIEKTGPLNKTGFAFDEKCLLYHNFPEVSERLVDIRRSMQTAGILDCLEPVTPIGNPEKQILRVHPQARLDVTSRTDNIEISAVAAVAAILGAVDGVVNGKIQNAFCGIRPPGHHSPTSTWQDGFCMFANAAIAARYAQEELGLSRICIIDWDFHHGNGTEDVFYDDDSVLFFSTHHAGGFPRTGDPARTGSGRGKGYNINVHLGAYAGDSEMEAAWDKNLLPEIANFKPELLLISAGFDSRMNDSLGCFNVSDEGFARLTQKAMRFMDKHGNGRIVSMLEGGYNTQGLACGVAAHVAALMGLSVTQKSGRGPAEVPEGEPAFRYGWFFFPEDTSLKNVTISLHTKEGSKLYDVDMSQAKFDGINSKVPGLETGDYFALLKMPGCEPKQHHFWYRAPLRP